MLLDSEVIPTLTTLKLLLQACEPSGNLPQAKLWFNKMEKAGVKPDVHACNSMLRTSAVHDSSIWSIWQQIRGGPSKEQLKWFLEMQRLDVYPNEETYHILTNSRNSRSISPAAIFIAALQVCRFC